MPLWMRRCRRPLGEYTVSDERVIFFSGLRPLCHIAVAIAIGDGRKATMNHWLSHNADSVCPVGGAGQGAPR